MTPRPRCASSTPQPRWVSAVTSPATAARCHPADAIWNWFARLAGAFHAATQSAGEGGFVPPKTLISAATATPRPITPAMIRGIHRSARKAVMSSPILVPPDTERDAPRTADRFPAEFAWGY